jgi:hypothetical protein
LPFLFMRTGSRTITELHERMIASRPAVPQAISSTSRLPL